MTHLSDKTTQEIMKRMLEMPHKPHKPAKKAKPKALKLPKKT